jgi:hypothetical protein
MAEPTYINMQVWPTVVEVCVYFHPKRLMLFNYKLDRVLTWTPHLNFKAIDAAMKVCEREDEAIFGA